MAKVSLSIPKTVTKTIQTNKPNAVKSVMLAFASEYDRRWIGAELMDHGELAKRCP